jgi:hypothetical protein
MVPVANRRHHCRGENPAPLEDLEMKIKPMVTAACLALSAGSAPALSQPSVC